MIMTYRLTGYLSCRYCRKNNTQNYKEAEKTMDPKHKKKKYTRQARDKFMIDDLKKG